MPGTNGSEESKRRRFVAAKDKYTSLAAQMYRQQKNPQDPAYRPGEPKSLCSIARVFEDKAYKEEGLKIKIDKTTLLRRAKGVLSQAESNLAKAWLTREEEKNLVDYAVQMGNEGWPLSQKRIEEHANAILHARIGQSDGFNGVGSNWTPRFLERHRDQLKAMWSHSLDTKRAKAGNPVLKERYFALLKKVLEGGDDDGNGESILAENIYGVDETGIQTGIGTRERVYGDPSKSIQHQQRGGNRENITVIATICADGTADIPPVVIYKAETFHSAWVQNNPLNALLGRSKKGYTNGEIGVEWMIHFEKMSSEKAQGRRRLLLVDGHNSHYTHTFLEHARAHRIAVLCYPSHSTHLYQGLDVVMFAPLKKAWSAARDEHERATGRAVSKSTFLEVYGTAHLAAFTKRNICAAFRKTGVVPFDPSVIPERDLQPSRTSSTKANLPLEMPSPVRHVVDVFHAILARQSDSDDQSLGTGSSAVPPVGPTPPSSTGPSCDTPLRRAFSALSSGSGRAIISNSPIQLSAAVPRFKPYTISPFQRRHQSILDRSPKTEHEALLHAALEETTERDSKRKLAMMDMQSQAVLNSMWLTRASQRLHNEKEASGKKGATTHLKLPTGEPNLLTQPGLIALTKEKAEAQKQAKEDKTTRKECRSAHSEALARWKAYDKARVGRNDEVRRKHSEETALWKIEVATAKSEKRAPRWDKPKPAVIETKLKPPTLNGGSSQGNGGNDKNDKNDENDENDGSDENDKNDGSDGSDESDENDENDGRGGENSDCEDGTGISATSLV